MKYLMIFILLLNFLIGKGQSNVVNTPRVIHLPSLFKADGVIFNKDYIPNIHIVDMGRYTPELDDIVAKAYVKNNDDLMVMENVVIKGDDAGFAVAIPKGDTELLEQVNKTLARLKEENKLEKFLEEAVELNNK